MHMKIPDFTKREMEYLIENCNFSEREEMVFRLRCKKYTLEKIAEKIHVCYKTAYRDNKKVKEKIIRVL